MPVFKIKISVRSIYCYHYLILFHKSVPAASIKTPEHDNIKMSETLLTWFLSQITRYHYKILDFIKGKWIYFSSEEVTVAQVVDGHYGVHEVILCS